VGAIESSCGVAATKNEPRGKPLAKFAVSPETPLTSDTVQLFDCSSDPELIGIAWRAWDFGDGATSVGLAPSHRYASAGDYEVTLTLATFDGRVGQNTQIVSIG
jgi:PKD repeat protein